MMHVVHYMLQPPPKTGEMLILQSTELSELIGTVGESLVWNKAILEAMKLTHVHHPERVLSGRLLNAHIESRTRYEAYHVLEALAAQMVMLDIHGPDAQKYTKIRNFDRHCNHIWHELTGLDKGAALNVNRVVRDHQFLATDRCITMHSYPFGRALAEKIVHEYFQDKPNQDAGLAFRECILEAEYNHVPAWIYDSYMKRCEQTIAHTSESTSTARSSSHRYESHDSSTDIDHEPDRWHRRTALHVHKRSYSIPAHHRFHQNDHVQQERTRHHRRSHRRSKSTPRSDHSYSSVFYLEDKSESQQASLTSSKTTREWYSRTEDPNKHKHDHDHHHHYEHNVVFLTIDFVSYVNNFRRTAGLDPLSKSEKETSSENPYKLLDERRTGPGSSSLR